MQSSQSAAGWLEPRGLLALTPGSETVAGSVEPVEQEQVEKREPAEKREPVEQREQVEKREPVEQEVRLELAQRRMEAGLKKVELPERKPVLVALYLRTVACPAKAM